ncbi:hypothetical protein OXYTRIMIC_260 [Oxytricha trifallax]|uniref:Uncharacterized protein n=1 Tax=Oxytricha trifallax TaxID=1172189 RepID=A0A073HXP8_9SPIT|nr:hypothetical protein OXYTRIMIC_260 [Oxytricha trifallax]
MLPEDHRMSSLKKSHSCSSIQFSPSVLLHLYASEPPDPRPLPATIFTERLHNLLELMGKKHHSPRIMKETVEGILGEENTTIHSQIVQDEIEAKFMARELFPRVKIKRGANLVDDVTNEDLTMADHT